MSCNCDKQNTAQSPISSIGSAIKDFVNGEYADTDTVTSRFNKCVGCEHLIKHEVFPPGNCSKCGCFVYLKIKMKNQKCPEGKW